MNSYRLVVLFKGDMDKKKREKTISDIQSWAGKVEDASVDTLGEKKLAYPIKGEQKAEYVVMKFKAEPVKSEFLSRLEINDEVLRHLLIRE